MYKLPNEKIISKDSSREIHLRELIHLYNELGLEGTSLRGDPKRPELMNTRSIQSPIISFSQKSLVLKLNSEQICKIRLDNLIDQEIKNIKLVEGKSNLFPKIHGVFEFKNGLKGIIMERIKVLNKSNYSSRELDIMYNEFYDNITKLNDNGIIHNDLGKVLNSMIRPNIILSEDKIRLIDFERIIFKKDTTFWESNLEKQDQELEDFYYELVDYQCGLLT